MVMNRRLKKQFWELRRHRNVLNYVRFPIGFYKASFHQLCVKWQSWDGFQKHTGVPWPHCGTGRCSTAVLGGNQVPQTAQDRPIPIQKNSSVVLHQWGEVFAQLMAKYSYCIRAGFPFLQSASTTFSETSLEARNQNTPHEKPPPLLRRQREEFHSDKPPVQPELHLSAQQDIDNNCPDNRAEQESLKTHTAWLCCPWMSSPDLTAETHREET